MARAYLPFLFLPTHEASAKLGNDLHKVAILAVRAVLRRHGSLEIAHQQIVYGAHHLAFSTRIGSQVDLIVEMALGDPALSGRIVLEDDLRRAERISRENAKPARWRGR